jgi:membrane fusion protein (multidrug efflux system)
MKLIPWFIVLSVLALNCRKEPEADSTPAIRVDVRTAPIRQGDVEETVSATGSTTIRTEAQLRSPVAGMITRFAFYNGDLIRSGETVAEVRSKESQASLQGAEALLHSSETPKQKEEAQQALELARRTSNTIVLRAPFTGILSNKTKNEMEVVSEGDQIASLVDPSSVLFLADVPSSSLSRIRTGQRASVRFTSKTTGLFQGEVHRIEPSMNPGDQTGRVHIVFTGEHRTLEGSLFGEASIVVGKRQRVLLVPSGALLRNDETNATNIMLVGPDSVAYTVTVSVGAKRDSLVEVSAPGLSPGNIVITEGQYGLPDSTKVRALR